MKFSITHLTRHAAVVVAVAGVTQLFGAQQQKTLPDTITIEKGKIYRSVQLVSAAPDGLVIEYKPSAGAVGLAKLPFKVLPEELRREFNYDETAAAEFESNRAKGLAEWRETLVRESAERASALAQSAEETQVFEQPMMSASADYPVGRFRATGTIRGAMILDTVTGEAWMVDMHSVLTDYQNPQVLQPKVLPPHFGVSLQ